MAKKGKKRFYNSKYQPIQWLRNGGMMVILRIICLSLQVIYIFNFILNDDLFEDYLVFFHQSISFASFFSLCWLFLAFFFRLYFLFFYRCVFYFRFFNFWFLLGLLFCRYLSLDLLDALSLLRSIHFGLLFNLRLFLR